MKARTPIILDVDTGIDDALAIAYAVKSPDAEVVAVTTVGGNVEIAHTTRNTLDVLDWLGASDVPVHRGASRPLVRPHRDAAYAHGTNGLGDATLPASTRKTGADRGPAAIIRMAMQRPGELTLVCVGPLTNLAIALNVEPGLPELLKRLVIMGGAYQTPGNVTKYAEFNFFCDPEAAEQVLNTAFPEVIAVGLDVSQQCAWPRVVWESAATHLTPERELVRRILHKRFTETSFTGFYLHDPLAVAVALDPTLVHTEPWAVRMAAGADERGATSLQKPAIVQVATEVDTERFLRRFNETLGLDHVVVDQRSLTAS